jgi:site-specific DNA-methyltransferase (adenine-specific)
MSEGKKEILLGDCLELMKDIPNGSVDMILCDLPYGTTACKWDSIIDLNLLWNEYKRVIKDDGAIVLTASQPFTTKLISSNYEMFKYEWIWEKSKASNFLQASYMPLKAHENILVFAKAKTKYNPQKTSGKPFNKGKDKRNGVATEVYQAIPNINGFEIVNESGLRNPRTVQYFVTAESEGKFHPTQKPQLLFEYLIKTYTNENDLVLDNTAGSGTTALACLNTNRQFILIEKEQKYYDVILKRVGDFNKNFETQTLFENEM